MANAGRTQRSLLTDSRSRPAFGWQMSMLFVVLLLVFVYLPIDVELPASLFALMFSGVLLAAIFAVRTPRWWQAASIGLAVLSIVLAWAATLVTVAPTWLELAAFASSALFVLYTMSIILVKLPHVEAVSVHTITAALSIYLLMGILGGLLFAMIETAAPGSFAASEGGTLRHIERTVDLFPPLLYFSFTTLTTLGPGDLYPASATGRAATILEAVAGQIYLVVMVALLVSMFAAQRSGRAGSEVVAGQAEACSGAEGGDRAGWVERTERGL